MSVNVPAEVITRIRHLHSSPSRVEMMTEQLTVGERIADGAAGAVGSWRFIIIQTCLVILWLVLNLIAWNYKWDPYPFILLNLMFSVQAAYTGPILLLASNRQSAKDRQVAKRDDEELGIIFKLQHEQMAILGLLREAQDKHNEILSKLAATRESKHASGA
jgi:uncharacterized membrane protein